MTTFTGGAKLEAKLRELAAKVANPATLRVGFLEGSTEKDGTSLPMVAALQNFGAPSQGIPPRPFFSNMIAAKKAGWGDSLARILQNNDFDVHLSLDQMGEEIKGQLHQSIVETNAPPLSPVTIMLRAMKYKNPGLVVTGSVVAEARRRVAAGERAKVVGMMDKPLVDTGTMLAGIGVEVVAS